MRNELCVVGMAFATRHGSMHQKTREEIRNHGIHRVNKNWWESIGESKEVEGKMRARPCGWMEMSLLVLRWVVYHQEEDPPPDPPP